VQACRERKWGKRSPSKILAILKDQEEECERLAGSMYTKGLKQSQPLRALFLGEEFVAEAKQGREHEK
jgi:hypothetical protein